MSYRSTNRLWIGRSITEGDFGLRTVIEPYEILLDITPHAVNGINTAVYALDEGELFARGSPHEDDATLLVSERQVTMVSPTKLLASLTYKTGPLFRPRRIQYATEQGTEEYFFDVNGLSVLNSALEPFERQPTRLKSTGIIMVQINLGRDDTPVLDAGTLETVRETLNQEAIDLDGIRYEAETLLMADASAELLEECGQYYYAVSLRIKVVDSIGTFEGEVADIGYYKLSGTATPPRVRVKDADQNDVVRPVALDGSGNVQGSGHPYLLTFAPYETADWGGLKIGDGS